MSTVVLSFAGAVAEICPGHLQLIGMNPGCARCQTGGNLLADRALSRLLKKDWPRSLEELEEMKGQRSQR